MIEIPPDGGKKTTMPYPRFTLWVGLVLLLLGLLWILKGTGAWTRLKALPSGVAARFIEDEMMDEEVEPSVMYLRQIGSGASIRVDEATAAAWPSQTETVWFREGDVIRANDMNDALNSIANLSCASGLSTDEDGNLICGENVSFSSIGTGASIRIHKQTWPDRITSGTAIYMGD